MSVNRICLAPYHPVVPHKSSLHCSCSYSSTTSSLLLQTGHFRQGCWPESGPFNGSPSSPIGSSSPRFACSHSSKQEAPRMCPHGRRTGFSLCPVSVFSTPKSSRQMWHTRWSGSNVSRLTGDGGLRRRRRHPRSRRWWEDEPMIRLGSGDN